MAILYYVNEEGEYLGGVDETLDPPVGHYTTVPSAPDNAKQIWDFDTEEWLAYAPCSIDEWCPLIPGSLLVLYHGIGHVPTSVNYMLKNIEACLGYQPGDIMLVKSGCISGKNGEGPALAMLGDENYLKVRFTSSSPIFQGCRFDTGARQNLNNDRWLIKFTVS